MSEKKTSIVALALIQGTTTRNKSAARVTGNKVGLDNYTAWYTALTAARMPFYRYAKALEDNAIRISHGEDAIDMTPFEDECLPLLSNILTAIGEVHGYNLRRSKELLSMLSACALKDSEELVGEALTVNSQIQNYRAQLRAGGNDEFIADIEKKKTEADERLKELKKLPGSCKPADGATSVTSFIKNMERKLGVVIDKQYRKGAEQVQKEEEERKAQSKAKAKANRQRKRAAEKATTESK